MTLLLGLVIRSSFVLAAGLLVSAGLAKRSAALRHRVLAATLLGAAVILPFNLVLPEWNVTVPAPVADSTPLASFVLPAPTGATTDSAALGSTASPGRPASAPEGPRLGVVGVILSIWFLGALAAGAVLAAGLIRVRRLALGASRVDDPQWCDSLRIVARRYRLGRTVVLSQTDADDLLATWGGLRPQVLLPRHAKTWPPERIHVVLCHELAHIRRHDWLVQLTAEGLRTVLWFNPLAWMVCTRLRRDSEQACDDEVLGMGVGGGDYAAHLIELARRCRRPGPTWAATLPMAHPSTLERRITAMLNPGIDRRVPSRRVLAALAVLVLLVTLPAALVRARQAGPAPLSGRIYDVTGAVLPGVEVSLAFGEANQVVQLATTNASGEFEFAPVAAGTYLLDVKLAGFRSLRQEIELRHASDWQRAVTLQIGDVRETISVRASRAAVPKHLKPSGAVPVRVGGNIRPPRKEVHVRPIYPASMHAAGLTGVVPLEALIDRDGNVASVRVLSAQIHPDFAAAAIEAVRQWRFTPTLLNGQPVEVVMTVSVRFDLEG